MCFFKPTYTNKHFTWELQVVTLVIMVIPLNQVSFSSNTTHQPIMAWDNPWISHTEFNIFIQDKSMKTPPKFI
jgi:hypothetical protein